MGYRFWDWLSCPSCDNRDGVKMMAYQTEIAIECYECSQKSEYTIGEDVPVHELDMDALVEDAAERE